MRDEIALLDYLVSDLDWSLTQKHSSATCLKKWSTLVRTRDSFECVICGASSSTAAHHVVRKSLLPRARYLPGNGATLCKECHREAHLGFNGRATLGHPVDYEGGEKLEAVAELFRALSADFRNRFPDRPVYYFLDRTTLAAFARMQGFEQLPIGEPIEVAWWLWDCAPLSLISAIVAANMRT